MSSDFSIDFPCAYHDLKFSGAFRSYPEDFVVNEVLGFEPSGEGEHLLLHIEKIGQNTHWVASELAAQCGVDNKAVGYCGRKDRHAVTQQWFSVYDPKRFVDQTMVSIEGVKILASSRHIRKFRPGDHAANQFVIRLRDCRNTDNALFLSAQEKTIITAQILKRLEQGIPNYFGSQRFGRELSNLHAANEWLAHKKAPPRQRKSMVMSAARAYLFNQVLQKRVLEQSWQTKIEGDVFIDNHPTAPLWGRGRLASTADALILESETLADFSEWCNGLEYCGLKQERRSLVLQPQSLTIQWSEHDIILGFGLPAGTFATAVLAEIATLR